MSANKIYFCRALGINIKICKIYKENTIKKKEKKIIKVF